MRFVVVAVLLCAAGASLAQTASYDVRFDATWTAITHPQNYPPGPHFSGLVGGTHDSTVVFWSPDDLASLGIRRMAEWGSQTELLAEVDGAILTGAASQTIAAPPLWVVPGNISTNFEVSPAHPLITLVAMLAPSPDWFVGVAGLDLRDNGEWVEELVVDLYVWDAGTDSGVSYTSPDLVTAPPDPVTSLDAAPFTPGVPVGRYTFTRQAVAAVPTAADLAVRVWPNPFNPRTTIAWELPAAGPVRVEIFDLAGRRVRVLKRGFAAAGSGSVVWDGKDERGRSLAAAAYHAVVTSEAGRVRRAVTLLK
ncbi:hypothetical protein DRQ50_08005 [bacterium]|nr:MAG: hypothetical protein DRQ50_08005 [bacterium]